MSRMNVVVTLLLNQLSRAKEFTQNLEESLEDYKVRYANFLDEVKPEGYVEYPDTIELMKTPGQHRVDVNLSTDRGFRFVPTLDSGRSENEYESFTIPIQYFADPDRWENNLRELIKSDRATAKKAVIEALGTDQFHISEVHPVMSDELPDGRILMVRIYAFEMETQKTLQEKFGSQGVSVTLSDAKAWPLSHLFATQSMF